MDLQHVRPGEPVDVDRPRPGVFTAGYLAVSAERSRMLWARGGHFGASQVPGCENTGPGPIDVDRLTGAHVLQVLPRELLTPLATAALPIPVPA